MDTRFVAVGAILIILFALLLGWGVSWWFLLLLLLILLLVFYR